nr:MAG TPA: TRAF PROTEIN, TRAO PROTEIN, TRAN ADHESION, BACTERIAL SECRETION.5A [Caudoviricetes sp.]DAX90530.1 MAG TPA: TRAF PROTEIN, TRAO PROTEIN, TRAN ADHESION, BACTERIAL SECRETION.5A [Caudoviricetes sp.]
MKKLLPILTIPLALAACSNDTEPDTTPTTETEAADATSAAPTDGLDYDREIGDELQLASNPTNDVTLKVTDITLGEECRYGTYDYGDEPHDLDGNQYLQVTAEVDAKHVLTDAGGDWITLNDPDILDKDGFTQTTGPAMDCQNADDGHEMWSTTIHSGEKKRIYGAFEVPQGVEKVSIEDYTFDVKDL